MATANQDTTGLPRISISTGRKVYFRWIVPIILFGVCSLCGAVAWLYGGELRDIVFLVLILLTYFFVESTLSLPIILLFNMLFSKWRKKRVLIVANEVLDGGGFLVVRVGTEQRILPLSQIQKLTTTRFTSPARVTLELVDPNMLRPRIVFFPMRTSSWNPFAKVAIAEDLMLRLVSTQVIHH